MVSANWYALVVIKRGVMSNHATISTGYPRFNPAEQSNTTGEGLLNGVLAVYQLALEAVMDARRAGTQVFNEAWFATARPPPKMLTI